MTEMSIQAVTPKERNPMKSAFVRTIRRFLREEDGPTAVEYAVMLMLIFLVVIATVQLLGQNTRDSIQSSNSRIQEAINTANGS